MLPSSADFLKSFIAFCVSFVFKALEASSKYEAFTKEKINKMIISKIRKIINSF